MLLARALSRTLSMFVPPLLLFGLQVNYIAHSRTAENVNGPMLIKGRIQVAGGLSATSPRQPGHRRHQALDRIDALLEGGPLARGKLQSR